MVKNEDTEKCINVVNKFLGELGEAQKIKIEDSIISEMYNKFLKSEMNLLIGMLLAIGMKYVISGE